MMIRSLVASTALLFACSTSFGQEFAEWFHKDWKKDKVSGVSTAKAYKFLKKRTSQTVTVAVIDSGVDIEHEDLKDNLWVNKGEVPGNGKDDDGNGYVDDVHGWSFLGNPKGENVKEEALEMTRMLRELRPRFDGKSRDEVAQADLADYDLFVELDKKVEQERQMAQNQLAPFEALVGYGETIKEVMGKDDFTIEELKALKTDDEKVEQAKSVLIRIMSSGGSIEDLEKGLEYFKGQLEYYYNEGFNPRTIVGDDPSDFTQTNYGSNEVEGPDAFHGTHVAGIIGAVQNNGKGIDGICRDVDLMVLRAVPDGDERDKDIALSIRYAVDNGADIINMSFGKSYSPYQQEVHDAIKYAEQKGVLLIHAAGNDSEDNDVVPNFPTHKYSFQDKSFSNYITVGASQDVRDEFFPAPFSNYGEKGVDIFAPGVAILSTVPQSEYKEAQGTSMASPVVAGVAALVKSYFPNLNGQDIRDVLLQSVDTKDLDVMMTKPGTDDKVLIRKLCVTEGQVNAYNAVKLASKMAKAKEKAAGKK